MLYLAPFRLGPFPSHTEERLIHSASSVVRGRDPSMLVVAASKHEPESAEAVILSLNLAYVVPVALGLAVLR